jgi:hypothetical protein
MEYKDEKEDPKKASANKTVKDLESRIRFLKQNGGTRRVKQGSKKTRRSI